MVVLSKENVVLRKMQHWKLGAAQPQPPSPARVFWKAGDVSLGGAGPEQTPRMCTGSADSSSCHRRQKNLSLNHPCVNKHTRANLGSREQPWKISEMHNMLFLSLAGLELTSGTTLLFRNIKELDFFFILSLLQY